MTVGTGVQITSPAMGTVMTHKAFGPMAQACLNAIQTEVLRLEHTLSRFLPQSDISRINRSAGIRCEDVSTDTFEILSQAVEFSGRCQGCFQVTIGPLVNLWKGNQDTSAPPDPSSVRQILPLVNDRDVVLDPWKRRAGLKRVGQSVDLGGIGKGYTGERILEIYQTYGVASAYSNLGGNVVTVGTKPDRGPWTIGIQHPRQPEALVGSVAVVNQTVVTSGDYQRYFTDRQGKRQHHILDPTTGCPSASGLISVTIVSEQALVADALSTIVFVAGMEKGLEILSSFAHTEAILVSADMQVYITSGLRYSFRPDNGVALTILD